MLQRLMGFRGLKWGCVQAGVERVSWIISIYLIPVVLVAVTLASLLLWDNLYTSSPDKHLELHVLPQSSGTETVADVQKKLALIPGKRQYETKLSEVPVWFSFKAPLTPDSASMVELPSRHVLDLACWDGPSLSPLGHTTGSDPAGALVRAKAGFTLKLDRPNQEVICRASFQGPARLTADLWTSENLDISVQDFHRKSGLLDGGMMVLAIFVLLTALINRQKIYIIFAAWLIVSLRVSATSGGWDLQWLNHEVPQEWLAQGRSVTRAVWGLLTVTLFKALFRDDLKKNRYAILINIAEGLCLALLLAAIILPRSVYLQTMWFVGSTALLLAMVSLVSIVLQTRSRVALWYAASLAITLLATLSEILAAAYGIKGLVGTLNTVTAALSSSLLAALAIAEQMYEEHKERLEVQAELEHTYEAMPIGLFTLDLRGRFMSANPALLGMLGTNVLTPGRNAWQQYFNEETWTRLHQLVHNNNEDEMEIRGKRLPGTAESKRFLVKATLARGKIEGSLQDVTEKSRATADLQFLANHDSLTKILNRRGIKQVINSAIEKVPEGGSLSLAYLDLDRFKLINDLFGHGAGDEVLRQVCTRVSGMLSRDIQFGRVGGDEFVILFPDTPIALASLMCRGIIDSISTRPYRVGDKAFHVRGSIGLVEISPGMQFNDAMSSADRACRQAKSANGAGLVVYERDALAFQQHEAELKLIALLATSSATDGLYLEMQPIMSLTAPHESLNFEVLLRMRDANGQVVRTDHLIAAGEASGRMGVIDRWVLATTLAWLDKNQLQMQHTKFVCMNLSGASLNDEKFLQDVYATFEQNLHIVGKLCLEITESVALHDVENTRRFVDKVRGYGAKVALDDFGAGYTSFSYLKEFTADLLKIDGSFIVNMNKHPANIAIVEAIVSLAKNLGMKVIAEWAEDNATVQTLTEIGVDYVQGFVVARPQHPDKLLTAESSASFIQDQTLAEYVSLIGKPEQILAQVDLFSEARSVKMH
ncbi:MAG: EAL domain-containing protein [Rhodoferax sp.]|uniref:EAL domain-containing protein n=1 Tax=Rhodoferax sp. TaxID=50421 RepID=UPI00272765B0|nr:EAL domain-containing protein [Rhodoferax sp.]MDO8448320.1 EAL domain-containing protein [Rhodoferax sp.]